MSSGSPLLIKPKPAQLAGPDRPAQTLGRGFFFWAAARPSSLGPASGPAQFIGPAAAGPVHWATGPVHQHTAKQPAQRPPGDSRCDMQAKSYARWIVAHLAPVFVI